MMRFYVPSLGHLTPKRGNTLIKVICRSIMRVTRWRFEGELPNIGKGVLIGAPHTSNWDFPLVIVAIFAIGIRLSWLGKHTFVNGPLKRLWHYLGGIPVNRQQAHGIVKQIVHEFNSQPRLFLGLSPEGTRSPVTQWKMGFYFIARAADVPVIPVGFDYGRKVIKIGYPIDPSADATAVMSQLQDFYRDVAGKIPQNFASISLTHL